MDPVAFLAIAYGAVFGGFILYLRSLVSRQRALESKIEQRSTDAVSSNDLEGP